MFACKSAAEQVVLHLMVINRYLSGFVRRLEKLSTTAIKVLNNVIIVLLPLNKVNN